MKLTQEKMDMVNALVTKTLAKELKIKEGEVPNYVTIGWKVCEDGLSRYFVSGSVDDTALKELGPILLDMCDQLANMGHLPKIKLHRDGLNSDKLIEGQQEYNKKKCNDCKGDCDCGENPEQNPEPHPWSKLKKTDWN